ncbi:MAG: Nramp family divalent metal transporter, partial [Planctomycetales bacterium]|nr:Nramp family divalent metal transporter [Planctomycetales bacterium]
MSNTTLGRPWYRRIGPGLITACVVIGPGSIMTSSKVGANDQYAMLWVVVVAVAFMMLFMSLGAKLGAVADQAPCDLIRRKVGRWLAVLVGLSVFFVATAFQSGNNIAVAAAFEAFFDSKPLVTVLVVLFNLLAISFLFLFKDLYKMVERAMMFFVALMLISFAINLILLKPDLLAMAQGFVPSLGKSGDMLPVLGLVGTTFVAAAAYYQAYLVRQKGWHIA